MLNTPLPPEELNVRKNTQSLVRGEETLLIYSYMGLLGGHDQTDHSVNGARIAGATPLPFESSSGYIMITYISSDVMWYWSLCGTFSNC